MTNDINGEEFPDNSATVRKHCPLEMNLGYLVRIAQRLREVLGGTFPERRNQRQCDAGKSSFPCNCGSHVALPCVLSRGLARTAAAASLTLLPSRWLLRRLSGNLEALPKRLSPSSFGQAEAPLKTAKLTQLIGYSLRLPLYHRL